MVNIALVIDDEADIRELITLSLDRIGLDTHTASNLEEARNLLARYEFDVCLTDMKLPDGNGVEFVKYILDIQPDLPVAVITAHGNMDAAVEAMKNGAFDFVSKPVDLKLLRNLVTQAIQIKHQTVHLKTPDSVSKEGAATAQRSSTSEPEERKLSSGTNEKPVGTSHESIAHMKSSPSTGEPTATHVTLIGADRLIGQSEPMQALKKMILKVARTNAPVWITGESGTGKELIARLIHDNGSRADAPFVAINCGAIPSELMESEMFGHRKGSFTGAYKDHDGLFKRAEGGTLFLDEVAELPLHMQVKLLRAIQERKVRPVGTAEEVSTNVRILSASHKDLATEVDNGHFRHDLYYRLNVICICAPSLRQRREDVVLIARHILKSIADKDGLENHCLLTPEAEKILYGYSYPGNVRELENILERAIALSDTDLIEACDLNLQIDSNPQIMEPVRYSGKPAANDPGERQMIMNALEQTRWNRKATAVKLGMTYRQLRYRIKQYGIDNESLDGTDG
ncbi:MAG: sigma-54-dependent transcriptional regulator [Granulosicoccus sp.]